MARRRFTPDQVRQIRAQAKTETQLAVGLRWGISASAVSGMVLRDTYRDVLDEPEAPAEVQQPPQADELLRKGDLVKLKSGGPTMTVQDVSFLGQVAVVYAVEGSVRTVTICETSLVKVS